MEKQTGGCVMLRREFIASLAALVATPALGSEQQPQMQLGAPETFDVGTVKSIARSLAQSAYRAPQSVPEAWTNISYDQYTAATPKPEFFHGL
ncbi:hypothetical protein [Planktotalea frisia]|nr:hypothetical protein [Planktotalea frisia]